MATTSVTPMGHTAHLMCRLSMTAGVRGGYHTPPVYLQIPASMFTVSKVPIGYTPSLRTPSAYDSSPEHERQSRRAGDNR